MKSKILKDCIKKCALLFVLFTLTGLFVFSQQNIHPQSLIYEWPSGYIGQDKTRTLAGPEIRDDHPLGFVF